MEQRAFHLEGGDQSQRSENASHDSAGSPALTSDPTSDPTSDARKRGKGCCDGEEHADGHTLFGDFYATQTFSSFDEILSRPYMQVPRLATPRAPTHAHAWCPPCL